jgi:hypothetical protein
MRRSLALHPDSVCEAVSAIHVDLASGGGGVLGLRYAVSGDIGAIAVPEPVESARSDRLWEHSCFEAFVADEEGPGYVELNVSPSTLWAGYRFRAYRDRLGEALLPPPRIEVERGADRLEVRVALRMRAGGQARRLGLSAVIEEANGRLSYWALAHPPGAPDFHDADCFAVELPPLG